MTIQDRLQAIAAELNEGNIVPPITVREFLSWFHSVRRGRAIVEWIKRELDNAGLATVPDFESLYLDSSFFFLLLQDDQAGACVSGEADNRNCQDVGGDQSMFEDPTYRLSKLAAANQVPISVAPNASIREAVTLMITHDFSQLPVMTSDREVKGVFSWASLGSRVGLGQTLSRADQTMDPHVEISARESLFQAIPLVVQHGYVLVRAVDKRVVGIVTASDLSLQFQQLTEPFLLIGEIENHIRRLLNGRIAPTELAGSRLESDSSRVVASVSDLTFGEYLRLLENPSVWNKLQLPIDRVGFCAQLERVRLTRNDVMHFDPDGIPPEDLDHLRKIARFLKRMQDMGVS